MSKNWDLLEKIEKINNLPTQIEKEKLLFQWVKVNHVSFNEYIVIRNELQSVTKIC